MKAEEFKTIAQRAADKHNADIFLYSGPIEDESVGELAEAVTAGFNGRDRAILILTTNGGSANAAFRIARLFQRTYEEFHLFCPGPCKSAGTLIALGANALIMDGFSELGPLDVQIVKEDEIGARKSGLLASATFDALAEQTFGLYETLMTRIKWKSAGQISFKLASELAANMTAQTIGELYAQMNPDVIGSERRSLLIAKRYGELLAEASDNMANHHSVDHLVHCYPSHDFVIDDEEARRWFKCVIPPSDELYELIAAIGKPAYHEMHECVISPLTIVLPDEEEDEDDTKPANDGDELGNAPEMAESRTTASEGDEGKTNIDETLKNRRSAK